jgi:hypothetical protein
MKIVSQPFFIFYASRLKEIVQIKVADAPDGTPSLSVHHHESKQATIASTPSSRFKERIIQVLWTNPMTGEEESMNFGLPLCAYGNEALRLSFIWPDDQIVTSKPIMITSTEQILQALAKYNFSYKQLSEDEKFSLLNELQQVEWKLGRGFEAIEVASLDAYFSSDLDRIINWLNDRMKLVVESPELIYLWNKGYLMACDDERIRMEMSSWFSSWTTALSSADARDAASAERLAVLTSMSPKTFALRMKMSGKTPLAFTMCHEVVRHRVEVVRNILSTLARADLQCIYNVRLKQVEVLQNVLMDVEYRDKCPSAEGYYEEFDGAGSWASLSVSTYNAFSARNRELEDALNLANASLVSKDSEIAFLQREIERLRAISHPSAIPLTNRINGSAVHIHLSSSPVVRMQQPIMPLASNHDNAMKMDSDLGLAEAPLFGDPSDVHPSFEDHNF